MNSEREEGLWVVLRKKSSRLEGPLYEDLLEEALCFGWIDSQAYRVDEDRMSQTYELDALIVPFELETTLAAAPLGRTAYESLNDSAKKWAVYRAKRPRLVPKESPR